MAEQAEPLRPEFEKRDTSDAASRVRASIEQFVEDLDVGAITRRIEEFGRQNPIGLAFAALTLGLAAGFLVNKNTKLFPNR